MTHAKPKWVYELQWVRWRLVKNGELDGTQRGIWKISESGIQRVNIEWENYNRNLFVKTESNNTEKIGINDNNIDRKQVEDIVDQFFKDVESILQSIELFNLFTQVNPYILSLVGTRNVSIFIENLVDEFILSKAKLALDGFANDASIKKNSPSKSIMDLLHKLRCIHSIKFGQTKAITINRLTLEFCNQFLLDDGSFDIEKIARYSLV